MKSAGKARNNGLYRHIRTSKEIIRNLLNYLNKNLRVRFLRRTLFVCDFRFYLMSSNRPVKSKVAK